MNAPAHNSARPAAVAGLFYPDAPKLLAAAVDELLNGARVQPRSFEKTPVKVLVVPHAGYVYSGPVAASGYAVLAPQAQRVRRVVLLGPAHRAYVRGLALPGVSALESPLGQVAIDADAVRALESMPNVTVDRRAHAKEHSLEVHLPFLQRVLGAFTVVPLVVGDATPEEVAAVIERVWGGDETLIVVSSDLSHYQPYETAQALDAATVAALVAGRPVSNDQACGARVLNGLSALRATHALTPHVLDLRNSGDTAGTRGEVVGYLALAFCEGAQ